MYLTKEGYKLTGDEVELPDEAKIRSAWLLTILDENKKEVAREILYHGLPEDKTLMYWIKRYAGRFCVINRISILDEFGDLPFTDDSDEYADLEIQGYEQWLRDPDDPAWNN